MSEPILKMVGLADNDKPNAVADIFADEMMDRVAGNVQAAKDVISNSMFDQELEIELPVELEPEVDDGVEVEEDDAAADQEEAEPETFESDQEILAEPDDQDDESEESED
jgi:hypothetical protein|tara:strand:+ start:74 stop:403 length:330 start_codon:yes stop_codon:yes gene_type:complete